VCKKTERPRGISFRVAKGGRNDRRISCEQEKEAFKMRASNASLVSTLLA